MGQFLARFNVGTARLIFSLAAIFFTLSMSSRAQSVRGQRAWASVLPNLAGVWAPRVKRQEEVTPC